jgi:hypothetical protein
MMFFSVAMDVHNFLIYNNVRTRETDPGRYDWYNVLSIYSTNQDKLGNMGKVANGTVMNYTGSE